MKTITTVIILLISSLFYAQDNYKYFPSYKTITSYFFKYYSESNIAEDTKLCFEKRPQGWYVTTRENNLDNLIRKNGLIWSVQSKQFEEINFTKRSELEPISDFAIQTINNWEGVHYNACPYFGYDGWDWDVINEYKTIDNLPDTTLYGVGRAYSSCASSLLHDNSGFADEEKRFKLADGKNCLNAEQLKRYRSYRHKAIEIFKKLNERDPKFETLVGHIGLKASHEHLTSFLDLCMYQNNEEALKELPDNVYNNFYVSIAKNYLSTCEKNAILFVNGDTDTYPLLYVQAKYNFRRDVTVINAGMLLANRYVEHLREPVFDAAGINFSFNTQALKNHQREVIYISKDSTKVWDLKKLMVYLNDDKNILHEPTYDIFMIMGGQFKTKLKGKTIEWQFQRNNYILQDELLVMDIILNHGDNRPVYFVLSLNSDKLCGLQHYLQIEGLAYKLYNENKTPTLTDGSINVEKLYNSLMLNFSYDGKTVIQSTDQPLISNTAWQFGVLAYQLIENKEKEKAIKVIDKYFMEYPNSIAPYNEDVIYLFQKYYELGEINKANDIGKQILFNMKNKLVHNPGLFDRYITTEKNENVKSKIKEASEKYGQEAFYKGML